MDGSRSGYFYNDLNAEQYDQLLKLAATGSAKSFD
jgi:hypothetical protein